MPTNGGVVVSVYTVPTSTKHTGKLATPADPQRQRASTSFRPAAPNICLKVSTKIRGGENIVKTRSGDIGKDISDGDL